MSETPAMAPSLSRGLMLMFGLAATTIVVAGLRSASGLVGPVFLALVLTIAVHPMRGWLQRFSVPAWASALLCVVTVYVLVVGLTLALVVATTRFAELLPTYQAQFNDLAREIGSWLSGLGIGQQEVQELEKAIDPGTIAAVISAVLGSLLGVVSDLFFILTLVLFLTVDASRFPEHLARVGLTRGPLVVALDGFVVGTRRYLIVSTVFGLIVAVIDTGALALLGIPVPLLWGLLAFITNYIPNIGFVIGLVPPAVLGLLEGGPGLCIAVIAVYSVINLVIQTGIQPKIVGDAVGLSTSLTFLSLVFWAWVLGALGALLAIPLSLLVKALLVDVDPRTRWLRPLLSNRASTDPDDPTTPAA
jgi:predicted PurR-regulated permease PerM